MTSSPNPLKVECESASDPIRRRACGTAADWMRLPDPALIKNRVSRPTDKAPRKAIDEFNPLDNL